MNIHKLVWLLSLIICLAIVVGIIASLSIPKKPSTSFEKEIISDNMIYLPLPKKITDVSVEEAILRRRSIRDYTSEPLTIMELSMLLWAVQGISEVRYGLRTAPSAGATYPLEIYVVVGENRVKVNETSYLAPGVYKYDVQRHALILVKEGDFRDELAKASLDQPWVRTAAIDIVICAVYERTTYRYGERGIRYVHMEVGHAAQNAYLMATALGLGTVVIGAFYDDEVAEIISAAPNEHPLYVIPVGRPVKPYTISFEDIGRYYLEKRGQK